MRSATLTLLMAMLVMTIGHATLSEGAILALISDGMVGKKINSTIEVITTYVNMSIEDCVNIQKSVSSEMEAVNFILNDDRSSLGTCTILTEKMIHGSSAQFANNTISSQMANTTSSQIVNTTASQIVNTTSSQIVNTTSSGIVNTPSGRNVTATSVSPKPTQRPAIHKDPCASNPCENHSKCTSYRQDFKCQCEFPMGGKTCKELICKDCYRKEDVVVYLNTTMPYMTWKQSYEYCEQRGLRMLLDKDESKHEFVQRLLAERFPKADAGVSFWIGLNRTSRTAQFRYTDGTWFDDHSHSPWIVGRPHNNLCVAMSTGLASTSFNWSTEECEEPLLLNPGRQYYPLCEQRYPFLTQQSGKDNPCEPNPCLHSGVCNAINGRKDFVCDCPYPMGGKICEDLICDQCYRQDELVIYLNTTMPSTTFMESYEYCENRGMTLLLDKDLQKHNFVREVLSKLYPKPSAKVAFWIGLNRTYSGAEFTYIDGTPINLSHAPWAPGRPEGNRCAVICSGSFFNFDWDDDDCVKTYLYPGWVYYPLCEKSYPFLSPFFGDFLT